MNTETKLDQKFEKTLTQVWDKGSFDAHHNAIRNIIDNRPEMLDEMDIQALKSILSDMDVFRAAKTVAAAH